MYVKKTKIWEMKDSAWLREICELSYGQWIDYGGSSYTVFRFKAANEASCSSGSSQMNDHTDGPD